MPFNFVIPEMTIGGADWSNSTFQFYKRGFSIGGSYSPSWQEIILSGNTALTLVNAKADGLNYVKLFGATEQRYSEIPKGYTKVESITFNETQYINTGILTATDLTIEIEFKTSSVSKCLFGGRSGSAHSVTCGIFNNNYAAYVNYGGATTSSTLSISLVDGEKHKIVLSANTFTVDGNSEPYVTGDLTRFVEIYLGTWNNSNSPDRRLYVGDIMSFKISNTQGVILNYIPVKNSNNVYGFYDTVSDVFITPTDGDAFTGGNVLTPSPDNRMPLWCNNGELKFGYTGTIGKNLFNVENSRLATVGVLQSDGSYYVANTTDIGYDYPAKRVVFEGEENVRYTISALIKTTTAANIGIAWVYSDNSTSYGTIGNYTTYTNYNTVSVQGKTVIGFALYGSNFNNTDMYIKDCQIEVGTKATTYTPYGYNLYTDGTTETVEITGKNLFDKNQDFIEGFVSSTDGTFLRQTNGKQRSFCVECKPNTTYILSGMTARSAWGSFEEVIVNSQATVYTVSNSSITTGANDKYLIGLAYTTDDTYDYRNTLQIEQGSTATTYEPYYSGGTAIAQNLYGNGSVKDVQEVLSGAVTRNMGVKILDGSESFYQAASSVTGYRCLRSSSFFDGTIAEISPWYCSHFATDSSATYEVLNQATRYNKTKDVIFCVSEEFLGITSQSTSVEAINAFKAWLVGQYQSNTPVIVIYPLATATTETVTAQPLTTQAGTNIVEITQSSIDNLGLEVSYMGGVSVTVTQVQNAQLSNDVTVTIGE